MRDLLTFAEAIHDADVVGGTKHALLGNGFSIACRSDCFRYDALLGAATFHGGVADIRQVFGMLGTADFEAVIQTLDNAARLLQLYPGAPGGVAASIERDASIVREALAQALAARHPDRPFDISGAEYTSARRFLGNFDRIYTLNYDMLLYWSVMQDHDDVKVQRNDGFGESDVADADYVAWQPYAVDDRSQRVYYLHGSLHLYDKGRELSKIVWSRTDVPLVDQIRAALADGRFPLIVTEGSSAEKEAKILHSAYLNHAIRSFARIQGSLFVYGHSLAANDEHVLKRIEEGSVRRLYVSLYGDTNSATNRDIVARAQQMVDRRAGLGRESLNVSFYDAASAGVWR